MFQEDKMNFYELVHARYSVRKYRDQPVPEDVLSRILEAARLAPSAANHQPLHFFVVRDAAVKQAMFPDTRHAWIVATPVIIAVCTLPAQAWVRGADGKNHADIDAAIAMDHIIMAATAEGLGTCWICAFDPGAVRKALDLPDGMEPVVLTPLGYAASRPGERKRKELSEIVSWK
jgi:nitroreductase